MVRNENVTVEEDFDSFFDAYVWLNVYVNMAKTIRYATLESVHTRRAKPIKDTKWSATFSGEIEYGVD